MEHIRQIRRHLGITGATLALCAGLAACSADFGDLFDPIRVKTHEEAATVNMTVTMVAPWDDLIDDLTPATGLTFAEAEKRALALTSAEIRQDQRSTGVGGQIGYQNLSGGAQNADEPPALKDKLDVAGQDRKASGLPKAEVPKEFAHDPLLALTAANALFQEGKLLEKMPTYAALRPGYRAYVLRLQLGVQPYRRNLPYDLFAMLSFFTEFNPSEFKRAAGRLNAFKKEAQNLEAEGKDEQAARVWMRRERFARPVQVLPLLVTDNLESSLSSRSRGDFRQITFALSAILPNLAANLSLSDVHELIRSFFGNELNGLLTVGRVSDNSLRVRLGAPRQPTAGFAMIPRTHNITLLVLVPDDYVGKLQVVARSEFRDVDPDGGEGRVPVLRPRHHAKEREDVAAALTAFAPGCGDRRDSKDPGVFLDCLPADKSRQDFLRMLITSVLYNELPAFNQALEEHNVSTRFRRDMWTVVVDTLSRNGYTADRVHLPKVRPPALPPAQSPVLVDDGARMVLRLQGGRTLRPDWLSALLSVSLGDQAVNLAAGGVELRSGRDPAFTFASIAGSAGADKAAWGKGRLTVTLAPATPWSDRPDDDWPGTPPAHCAAASDKSSLTCTYGDILALKPAPKKDQQAAPAGDVGKAVTDLKKAVDGLEKALKAKK